MSFLILLFKSKIFLFLIFIFILYFFLFYFFYFFYYFIFCFLHFIFRSKSIGGDRSSFIKMLKVLDVWVKKRNYLYNPFEDKELFNKINQHLPLLCSDNKLALDKISKLLHSNLKMPKNHVKKIFFFTFYLIIFLFLFLFLFFIFYFA